MDEVEPVPPLPTAETDPAPTTTTAPEVDTPMPEVCKTKGVDENENGGEEEEAEVADTGVSGQITV